MKASGLTYSAMRIAVFLAVAMVFISTAVYSETPASIHDFTMKTIKGEDVPLKNFAGKAVMIVNVASKCGMTPQYDELQKLYETYGEKGFVILGFPANNFANQEPGTNREIEQFCRLNYGVTFPMFGKISVKGKNIHPLYAYLTSKETNKKFAGDIQWNFTKFLFDENGQIINRFAPKTKPSSYEIVKAIEDALKR